MPSLGSWPIKQQYSQSSSNSNYRYPAQQLKLTNLCKGHHLLCNQNPIGRMLKKNKNILREHATAQTGEQKSKYKPLRLVRAVPWKAQRQTQPRRPSISTHACRVNTQDALHSTNYIKLLALAIPECNNQGTPDLTKCIYLIFKWNSTANLETGCLTCLD